MSQLGKRIRPEADAGEYNSTLRDKARELSLLPCGLCKEALGTERPMTLSLTDGYAHADCLKKKYGKAIAHPMQTMDGPKAHQPFLSMEGLAVRNP